MHYLILCTDKAGKKDLRAANRPAHLEYLGRFKDRIFAAGPTLGDDGETPTGSALIVDFPDRTAADDFCAGDPYATAGLFDSVIVRPWKKAIPAG